MYDFLRILPDHSTVFTHQKRPRPKFSSVWMAHSIQMSIEFIGMIASEQKSEIHPAQGPVIDPDYIVRFAQATIGS